MTTITPTVPHPSTVPGPARRNWVAAQALRFGVTAGQIAGAYLILQRSNPMAGWPIIALVFLPPITNWLASRVTWLAWADVPGAWGSRTRSHAGHIDLWCAAARTFALSAAGAHMIRMDAPAANPAAVFAYLGGAALPLCLYSMVKTKLLTVRSWAAYTYIGSQIGLSVTWMILGDAAYAKTGVAQGLAFALIWGLFAFIMSPRRRMI